MNDEINPFQPTGEVAVGTPPTVAPKPSAALAGTIKALSTARVAMLVLGLLTVLGSAVLFTVQREQVQRVVERQQQTFRERNLGLDARTAGEVKQQAEQILLIYCAMSMAAGITLVMLS